MKNRSFSIVPNILSSTDIEVSIQGQLVIKNSDEIKKDLLKILNYQNLKLVFTDVVKLDLSVLQLLIALEKSALKLNKQISFDFHLINSLQSVLHISDLCKIFSAHSKTLLNGYINTVLIVDDSTMISKVLSFMIKKAGYNILTATDGKNALEFFDGREIDLVVTDLNMPGMDGLQLISELRATKYYRYMPVILFIPDSEEERKEILKTSGATMLFDKKNIKEKIIPTIRKMIA
jgi:two-component system chemotaxis response regulator CheY